MTGNGKAMGLDPQLTFESFVVGPANRLAHAAARRSAESPGTAYNPLFLYSAAGLGKSHILNAIAHYTSEHHPDRVVRYGTVGDYLAEIEKAIEEDAEESIPDRYAEVGVLLLDDVQLIADQARAQEVLLRSLDALSGEGAQIVLASDRPPAEISGLDARLLSRFSGGLIVDIGPPHHDTRVAILRKKAEASGVTLEDGVAEALSGLPLTSVHDLKGALDRVLAVQESEGRSVTVDDIPGVLEEGEGERDDARAPGETEQAPAEPAAEAAAPTPAPGPADDEAAWRKRIYRAADAAKAELVSPSRIVRLLNESAPPEGWEDTVQEFEDQLERIRAIRTELTELGDPWPEAAATLLTNPDRLDEAESLLASARQLRRPFPDLPPGPGLRGLGGRYPALAVKAAEQLIRGVPSTYNPLYVHAPEAERSLGLICAAGRSFAEANPEGTIGLVSVSEFAHEFIHAIQEGVAGAWRERWWDVDLLLLHGIEELSSTERAEEEVFHLLEALVGRGGRILIGADRPPREIEGVDDRLISRFEGGLVVDLGPEPARTADRKAPAEAEAPGVGATEAPPTESDGEPEETPTAAAPPHRDAASEPQPAESPRAPAKPGVAGPARGDDLAAVRELVGVADRSGETAGRATSGDAAARAATGAARSKPWVPSPEKVVWDWPEIEHRIAEDAGGGGGSGGGSGAGATDGAEASDGD